MPSTRNPPLNTTLPSMRVVAPIRLSMRFCGLLVLLNMIVLPSLLERHGVGCAGLAGAVLVHPHLHALDTRLRVDPEGPLNAPEVLECQLEFGRPGVRRLGETHHSTLVTVRQTDDQLEAPVKFALAPRGRREQQEVIAVLARQYIGLDLEAIDGQRRRRAGVGREHALEGREFLAHSRVLLLERADLLG